MSAGPTPVWDAIARKRAIRRFAAEPLAPDHLDRILRAGRHAPSSKNRQRWTFIVCEDREHLRELAAVGPFADHIAGAAVAVALVTPDPASAWGRPIDPVRCRNGRRKHDAGRRGSWGSAASPRRSTNRTWRGSCWGSRPTSSASTSCRSAIRPIRPTSRDRRRPAGAARSTTWCGGNAGSRPDQDGRASAYCQRNLRAAIPKHTTSHTPSTAKHAHSGANGAPPTMTWRSASDR